jgi:hypothetical protein
MRARQHPREAPRKGESSLNEPAGSIASPPPAAYHFFNSYPDYATLGASDRSQLGTSNYTEYLERFVAEVRPQLISYDNYRVQYSQDLQKPASLSPLPNDGLWLVAGQGALLALQD